MPPFLSLSHHTLTSPDGTVLCPDLTLAFGRERTGIVGQNGSGKSTLLALLAAGHPDVTGSGTVGRLEQSFDDRLAVTEALGVSEALGCIARIEAGVASAEDLNAADWTLQARVEAVLARFHLPPLHDRLIGDLSGGQRMRVGLARVTLEAPDILLLDEPTNNLDDEGRALVRDMIASWAGGVVVASHDRDLLERMDRIVELTPKGALVTGGGWSAYADARAARLARDQAALAVAERDVARTRREMAERAARAQRRARQGRALRASGSHGKMLMDKARERSQGTQARDARLDARLAEVVEQAQARAADRIVPARDLRIGMDVPDTHGVVLDARRLTETRGDFRLGPLDLSIRAGEHVALSGPNGSGKSTLITALMRLPVKGGAALLDQNMSLIRPEISILDALRNAHHGLSINDAYATLARFAFRNADAERVVGTLSGGERLRAGLAVVLGGSPPGLLILDEPTNHLDVEAVETLEMALADYAGALMVVSHDAAFLDAIRIDRVIRLAAGEITD